MSVFDGFTFYNEYDVLEIRLKEIFDVVDYFVIVESGVTFRGDRKPFNFLENIDRYQKWIEKIVYVQVHDMPEFKGDPWELERFQRNCIVRGLDLAGPEDLILISDVDEIPSSTAIASILTDPQLDKSIFCFEQKLFMHYLNWLIDRPWYGTRALKHKFLKQPQFTRKIYPQSEESGWSSLKHQVKWLTRTFRYHGHYLHRKTVSDGGWHFSYLGNADFARKKIRSFSHTEFDNLSYIGKNAIEDNIKNKMDLFGRSPKIIDIGSLPISVQKDFELYSNIIDI